MFIIEILFDESKMEKALQYAGIPGEKSASYKPTQQLTELTVMPLPKLC
ncbi:hypothetical protein PDR5_25360 [Pseudomonas sp. DR 5-09]|nr:hypothetical protein PDR5_25360 [Pseudomonas sp. DR 5-09]